MTNTKKFKNEYKGRILGFIDILCAGCVNFKCYYVEDNKIAIDYDLEEIDGRSPNQFYQDEINNY